MKGACVSSPRFPGELSGRGLVTLSLVFCDLRLVFGLASRVRGPSFFGDPSLVPHRPRYVGEANYVWRGYLKIWLGCGTLPVRLGAEFGRVG